MKSIVAKQAMTLGLSMGAGIISATVGDLSQNAVHVSGYVVGTAVFGVLLGLIMRYGPDGWR